MIKIKNLTKKYDSVIVLNNASYSFPSKGLVCLTGKSGSGKTTLLNILAGFDSNYAGNITICNTDITSMKKSKLCNYRRENIGFVFQNYQLLTGYTVLENIILPCYLGSQEKHEYILKAKEIIKKLGLVKKENEKIENLSGGQKQRVAIARALIGNPNIILADEPTGALDRKNSNEIMDLLKQISEEKLVIVITHDPKICDFADEIIAIENEKVVIKKEGTQKQEKTKEKREEKANTKVKVKVANIGIKNFKVHLAKWIVISLAISISIICFMLSLSSRNIMNKSINDFKDKNTAFNNGYIKISKQETDIFELLSKDERIENIYKQYKIEDVRLSMDNKSEIINEKYPMPKAIQKMSYGVMPKLKENKIALSPSLAKKFTKNINELIGKNVVLTYNGNEYKLMISGIFNADYDDFFVSSDIEQEFYKQKELKEYYAISYDVKKFEEIVNVSNMLHEKNIDSKNVSKEVSAFQNTFENLKLLFLIISILIIIIGLFIGIILIFKLQFSRYKEVGLLSALGFNPKSIQKIILSENILLFIMTVILNIILIGFVYISKIIFTLPISISILQIIFSSLSAGVIVMAISILISIKIIRTEPAIALKK